jgi:hypothetical protein
LIDLFVENKLDYMNILNENYTDKDIKMLANSELYGIFRLTRTGSWDDLKTEFMNTKPNFHFLKLLIDKFEDIKLLSNLYPIITFTNYMLNLCNYKYSRNEAKEIKIKDVIQGNLTAENLFIEFAKSYKNISYNATQWQCKVLPPLEGLTIDIPLSFVLIDDRELGYGMYIAAAFQYLGTIQNELLEAIVYLIKENNKAWENIDYHKYGIQKLSSHQIILCGEG